MTFRLCPWLLLFGLALPAQAQTPTPLLRSDIQNFITAMQQTHGFDSNALSDLFAHYTPNSTVLRLITPPVNPKKTRSWQIYRSRFITPVRINGGVKFMQRNTAMLAYAQTTWGIPPEIIAAIIGVETVYGANTGNFNVLQALATLAFDYPPRANLFRSELEHLLLLARENNVSPLSYYGSYAGAMGLGQFLPSSLRRYGVDCNGDGRVDIAHSEADAICSVARYLQEHGWQPDAPIALPVFADSQSAERWVAEGIEPRRLPADMRGVNAAHAPQQPAALIELATPDRPAEYWLGYQNFYVITRYNRSSFYAMSVLQLANAIRLQRS